MVTSEEVRVTPAEAVAEARARKKRRTGSSGPRVLTQVIAAQARTLVEVKKEKTALADEVEGQEEEYTTMTVFSQLQQDAIDRLKALAAERGADFAEVAEAARVGRR